MNARGQPRPSKDVAGKEKSTKRNTNWMIKGSNELIQSLQSADVTAAVEQVSSAAGFELLCTYNWALAESTTIYVPGAPSKWTPQELPVTLPQDSGTHFIDQNAFKCPKYTFEPIFQALSVMKPSYSFRGVDIVTNRNSLRNLLSFVQGRAQKSFRIDLNLVHETLFLTRREKNVREIIRGSANSGFGHNFEQAFTTPEPGMLSSSHHRIVRYKLGSLDCVVRFEVDAWCDDDNSKSSAEEIEVKDDADSLSKAFSSLAIGKDTDGKVPSSKDASSKEASSKGPNGKDVKGKVANGNNEKKKPGTGIIRGGREIPCASMAEVKSKSKSPRLADLIPQLWFGRTPHLFISIHQNGTFQKIRHVDVAESFPDWEMKQQEHLQKLVQLMGKLKEIVTTAGVPCFATCDHKSKPLTLHVFTSKNHTNVLPAPVVKKFWSVKSNGK